MNTRSSITSSHLPHFLGNFDLLEIHGIEKLCIVQSQVLTPLKELLDIILIVGEKQNHYCKQCRNIDNTVFSVLQLDLIMIWLKQRVKCVNMISETHQISNGRLGFIDLPDGTRINLVHQSVGERYL